MKIELETDKKIYQLTFTNGFSFRSPLTLAELRKLIHTYRVASYKVVKEGC